MAEKDRTGYKRGFNERNYDRISVTVPKGRKQQMTAFAKNNNESVNGMINRLVQSEMMLTDDQWNKRPTE